MEYKIGNVTIKPRIKNHSSPLQQPGRTFSDDWDQGTSTRSNRQQSLELRQPQEPRQKTLFDYIQERNVDEVKKILDEKPHLLNSRQTNSKTPLETAMDTDSPEIVRLLLQRGANVDLESTARGRITLLELAQNQDVNGFWKIMDMYSRTLWTPGSDPDLMHTEKEYEKDAIAAAEIRKLEKNQVSTFLEDLGQTHNIPLFEKHELGFMDFMRLMEEDLKAIGIESTEDIEKIVDELKILNTRKWKSSMSTPQHTLPVIQSAEAIGVLNNLISHTDTLSLILNAAKNRVEADPKGLRKNLEKAHLMDLNQNMEAMFTELDLFLEDVENLGRAVEKIKPVPATVAAEPKEKKSESNVVKHKVETSTDAAKMKLQDEDEQIKVYQDEKRRMMYISGCIVGGYAAAWGFYYYYYFVKK